MPVPTYQKIYAPFLRALKDGEEHHMKEIKQSVIMQMHLTDADLLELLPSGKQTVFENRIGWARTYLKKAGLIYSPSRSYFTLTEEGKKAISDIDMINDKYLRKYRSFRVFRNIEEDPEAY